MWDGVNGVDLGDSLGTSGRGGLAFGSGKTVLSSVEAGAGTGSGSTSTMGERERFLSFDVSDSKPFSCDVFGSSLFSSFLQFSSVRSVSICAGVAPGCTKRTISGTAPATIGVCGVATICHSNFVFLIDMAAPHTLRIHPGIGTTTKGAPQARFLTLGPGFTPAFLEVLFLCRTPAPRRFKLSRIWNSVRVGVPRRDEVLWVQEPVFVFRHNGVCKTLRILLDIWKICKRRVEEDRVWVSGCGVHWVHDMS